MQCKLFEKSVMDLDQGHFAPNSFYSKCTNNATGAVYTGKRQLLLDAQPGIQACYASQYNEERGNDVCYECPQGLALVTDLAAII